MSRPLPFIVFLFLTCNVKIAQAQCEPCSCDLKRMPEIRMSRAIIANCSGVDNFYVPRDLPEEIAVLDLSHNRFLRNLKAVDLNNYLELRMIVMNGNNIERIEPEAFVNLTKMERLVFTGSHFGDLPADIFSGMSQLKRIEGLHTSSLAENTFSGLERLIELSLTVDDTSIPEIIFQDLTLTKIDLALPNCESLPARLLESGQTSIRSLRLVANRLTSYPEELFNGLTLLHNVYLETDAVQSLPDHLLHGQHESNDEIVQLQSLTLCGIDVINDHVLTRLGNLVSLVIQRPLEIYDNAFSDLDRIDHLEVSSFDLTGLNREWFKDLPGLKELNLSSNHIAMIDGGVLSGLQSLTLLDLSYNNISNFQASALDSFRNFIEVLDLSHNSICELPPSVFMRMYTLQKLNIENNCLDSFAPGLFTEQSSYYDDYGQYDEYENYYFQMMKDMTEINLRNNRLEQISFYVFNQMGYLKAIDLSNNHIRTVTLGEDSIETLSMELIDLSNNPLECGCDLIQISILARKDDVELLGTCASPVDLRGVLLKDLARYASRCAPLTTTVGTTTVAETTVATTTVAETTVAETTVAETTVAETSVATTTVAETTVAETTVAETMVAETTIAETTVTGTTVSATIIISVAESQELTSVNSTLNIDSSVNTDMNGTLPSHMHYAHLQVTNDQLSTLNTDEQGNDDVSNIQTDEVTSPVNTSTERLHSASGESIEGTTTPFTHQTTQQNTTDLLARIIFRGSFRLAAAEAVTSTLPSGPGEQARSEPTVVQTLSQAVATQVNTNDTAYGESTHSAVDETDFFNMTGTYGNVSSLQQPGSVNNEDSQRSELGNDRFFNQDGDILDIDNYIHYLGDDNQNTDTADAINRSQNAYNHQQSLDENPFNFNQDTDSNISGGRLHDIHNENSGEINRNEEINNQNDLNEDGNFGNIDIDVAHAGELMVARGDSSEQSTQSDYFYVKLVAIVVGGVCVVVGSIVFVVKMRGILYTWDYNTRRLSHF